MNKLSLLYRRNLGILDGFLWGLNCLFLLQKIFLKTLNNVLYIYVFF